MIRLEDEGDENIKCFKELLNWGVISDEEVVKTKQHLSKIFDIPLPFKVNMYDIESCKCDGRRGKIVKFNILVDDVIVVYGMVDKNGIHRLLN
jgi:hypothetical protein